VGGYAYVAQGFSPAHRAAAQQQAPAGQAPSQQTPAQPPPAPQTPAQPAEPPPSQAPAQQPPPSQAPAPQTSAPPTAGTATPPKPAGVPPPAAAAVVVPPDYVIGPDDILSIAFWRDKEMTTDVVVRPDGRITLPLVNDVPAGGLTPEQLRERVHTEATKYIEDPRVTVTVKQINSRRVFIMGQVGKAGAYPLSNPTTVLQLLSMAGGVGEFADAKKIMIMRIENGKQLALRFNYKDVSKGKNLEQNILLKPGDTVVVP
jgi:polysaccharide biosynthesis/export protein